MAKHDVKLMQIFKRYLNKPGDEVVIVGSAVRVGPLMKQKVFLHAQFRDGDAESAPYRIDKAIDWAEKNLCVVLERKRKILSDGSEDAELIVDVEAIANAVRNDILGRYLPGKKVSVELKGRTSSHQSAYGMPLEYSPGLRTRFNGTLIKEVGGGKWQVKSDDGDVYTISEADIMSVLNSSVLSRNAVVQKALNAVARNSTDKVSLDVLKSEIEQAVRPVRKSFHLMKPLVKRGSVIISFAKENFNVDAPDFSRQELEGITRAVRGVLERHGMSLSVADVDYSGSPYFESKAVNGKFKVGDHVKTKNPKDSAYSDGIVTEVKTKGNGKVFYLVDFGYGCYGDYEEGSLIANSARSTNAVVAKAMDARRS